MGVTSGIKLTLQTAYAKIALTRTTRAFFILSVLFCFAQGIIQSFLYSQDTSWRGLTAGIVALSGINDTLFIQYDHHNRWDICDGTPISGASGSCVPFYTSGEAEPQIPAGFRRSNTPQNTCMNGIEFTNLKLSGIPTSNGTATVTLMQQDPPGQSCELDPVCLRTMLYPNEKLRQAMREDLSFIALQFWLLGVAIFAIMFESIPHLIALICARFLSVVWSSYTIWRTYNLADRIAKFIGNDDTPCHLDIFPPYFSQRVTFQIVDLVLHSLAFIWTLILAWHLIQVFLRATFKRVGPPRRIVVIYRCFLTVLAGLQLSAFFLVLATSLWIDQLMNSALTHISSHTNIYQAAFISTAVLLVPWIAMGWYAVRYEKWRLMVAFLGTSSLFIAMWSLMFYSRVYRFSFIDWPFFGCMTCISFVVMFVSVVFGVVCWRKFGQGLAQYLYVESTLRNSAFEPDVFMHDKEDSSPRADRRLTFDLGISSLPSQESLPPYSADTSINSLPLDSKAEKWT